MDRHRADAFAGQMRGLLNHAMLGLMVSIGHRTGLFDAMAALPPSPSGAVADAAGLDERYVREWLGAMVTGGIVEYDGRRATYFLPREHAASLTGAGNLARLTRAIGLYGVVEDRVIDCFRTGGGLPASVYGEDAPLFTGAPAAPSLVTFVAGLAGRLARGLDVLEVTPGAGALALAFPASRVACVAPGDLATLPAAAFDLATAEGAVHRQAAPTAALAALRGVLRPGGLLLLCDVRASSHLADNVEHPLGPALYAASTLHSLAVSRAHGGPDLGAMWGEEKARAMILAAGFATVEERRLDDPVHTLYVARA